MMQILLNARWPGLALFACGGLLLCWSLLAPQLEPRDLLRWGRGRVEHALVPLAGPRAAPGIAAKALWAAAIAFLLGGLLLVAAFGVLGVMLAPLAALLIGRVVAERAALRRRERLAEQVQGLAQALAAGLAGSEALAGTVFSLLRRLYRQMEPPLKEEFAFLELVLRGQADLGDALPRAAAEAAEKHTRALLELLGLIYRDSLDKASQRRALQTLLRQMQQDERVRRTVRVESRFGQASQAVVLVLIPAFVGVAAIAGSLLGSEFSVADFYFRTMAGRLILAGAALVEGLVVWISRRMVRRVRWD
ncbi:MAG: hypothetical protein ACP5SI_06650 [Chloroflexia bacterium]